ncbi:MAG: twin-arginine translocase subunit TatC [Caldilineaceae bacterium]
MSQQTETIPMDPIDASRMTLMEHLIELRMRLIWVSGALILGTAIALGYFYPILDFLAGSAKRNGLVLQLIGPTDSISIIFKVCFTVGTAIALPVIIYQIIAFMAPGLYPQEKRTLLLTLPAVVVLFAIGSAFAYYVLLPVAIVFLGNILSGIVESNWTFDRYISFITRLVFWIGVSFEMPLIFAFLSRLGLVDSKTLLKYWRHAIVVIAIIAAIITPTVDPVNMSIVMGPLIVLYGLSILLAWLLYRPRAPRDFSQESFIPDEYKDK